MQTIRTVLVIFLGVWAATTAFAQQAATLNTTLAPNPIAGSPNAVVCGFVESTSTDQWEFAVADTHIRTDTFPCVFQCNLMQAGGACGVTNGIPNICYPPIPRSPGQNEPNYMNWYHFVTGLNNQCGAAIRYYKRADLNRTAYAFRLQDLPNVNFGISGLYIRAGVPFQLLNESGAIYDQETAPTGGRNFAPSSYAVFQQLGGCSILQAGTTLIGPNTDVLGNLRNYSIIVGIQEPTLTIGLSAGQAGWSYTANRYAMNTAAYVNPSNSRMIVRRCGTPQLEVLVSTGYSQSCYKLEMELTHTFNSGPPVTIPISEGSGFGGSGWEVMVVGSPLPYYDSTNGPMIKVTLQFSIPDNAAIGYYDAKVVLRRRDDAEVIANVNVPGQLAVLFNPWCSTDQTSAGPIVRDTFLQRTSGALFLYPPSPPTIGTGTYNASSLIMVPWTFSQYDSSVFEGTMELLNGLPDSGRRDPVIVGLWLTRFLHKEANVGLLFGKWRNLSTLEAVTLLNWHDSADIFREWRATMHNPLLPLVGQCWIFSAVTVSSLRTLGICARPVTCTFASVDADQDGHLKIYWKFDPTRPPPRAYIVRDGIRQVDWQWNYHNWAEGYMKRPDYPAMNFNNWQAMDSTYVSFLAPPPSRHTLGPAPVNAILTRSIATNFDVDYFVRAVDPTIEHYCLYRATQLPGNPVDFQITNAHTRLIGQALPTRMATKILTAQDSSPLQPKEITGTYRPLPGTGGPDPSIIPELAYLGQNVDARISFVNEGTVERTYGYSIKADVISNDGRVLATVLPTVFGDVAVAPGGYQRVPASIDANAMRPWFSEDITIEWSVGSWCEETQSGDTLVERTIRALPSLAMTVVPDSVRPMGWTKARIEILDAAPVNLSTVDLVLRIQEGGLATFEGGVLEKPFHLGAVLAGTPVAAEAWVRARVASDVMIAGKLLTPEFGQQTVAVDLRISGCAADFDGSGDVTADDIFAFLSAWFATGGCGWGRPADVNGDGCVTTGDIFAFINTFLAGCP